MGTAGLTVTSLPFLTHTGDALLAFLAALVLGIGGAIAGIAIVGVRPRDRVGWVLVATGTTLLVATALCSLTGQQSVALSIGVLALTAILPIALFLFPTGDFSGIGRWLVVPTLLVGGSCPIWIHLTESAAGWAVTLCVALTATDIW